MIIAIPDRSLNLRTSALTLAAGVMTALACASPALAINEARGFLNWFDFEMQGATGKSVVIANVEGQLPLAEHKALSKNIGLLLAWPFASSPSTTQTVDRTLPSRHATAVSSALVGNVGGVLNITGMAPSSTLLAAAFGTGVNQDGGVLGTTNTSQAFALFALTDQALANEVAAAVGIPQYKVATVLNSSVGDANRIGEDGLSDLYNAVASQTGVTIVCPAGDDGQNMTLNQQMPMLGRVRSPAAAHNTISVGRSTDIFSTRSQDSSDGPTAAIDWRLAGNLIDPNAPGSPGNPPPDPTDPNAQTIEMARPGVDIIAPGGFLRLAGSIASPVTDVNAFSTFWTGTSYASAIVAGAVALVQDLGNIKGLWDHGKPTDVLMRSLIINSAEEMSFSNMAQAGMPPNPMGGQPDDETLVLVTTLALDPREGAGFLNLRRLMNQVLFADVRDVTGLPGFTRNPATGNYDIPTIGTDVGVPFVTTFVRPQVPEDTGDGNTGGPGPGGPITKTPSTSTPDNPITNIPDWRRGGDLRPLQLGSPSPDLDTPTGGPGTMPKEIPNPQFPIPTPRLPNDPNNPFGLKFSTGWDHGNLGLGFIDVPIGVITPDSKIVATLCWDRHHKWKLPDFAGPLHFVSPALVVPTATSFPARGASETSADRLAPRPSTKHAAGALDSNIRGRQGAAIKPAGAIQSLWRDRRIHTYRLDGCTEGSPFPVLRNPDGSLVPPDEALAKMNDLFDHQEKMLPETIRAGVSPLRAGLDIQFLLSPAVQQDASFVAALNLAASIWEGIITDPVTVSVAVDFTFSEDNFIAVTNSPLAGLPYADIRKAEVSDASFVERDLQNALPNPIMSWNSGFGPIDTTGGGGFIGILLALPNAKALGLNIADPNSTDAFISFNTKFTFDNDPTDGVNGAVDIDTVFVMLHELGHMLGFISDVEAAALFGTVAPSTLDMYRFGLAGTIGDPNTLTDFRTFRRELGLGVEAALDTADGVNGLSDTFRFSTGAASIADGRQASHWKDDVLTGSTTYIGVMDPTYSAPEGFGMGIPELPDADGDGVRDPGTVPEYITFADKLALSLIGWDIAFSTSELPPSMTVPVITSKIPPPLNGLPRLQPEVEFAFANLDLELYRVSESGIGSNTKVAASRTIWNTTEHISIGGQSGGSTPGTPGGVLFGRYFLRVIHKETMFDFGGSILFNLPSILVQGYDNIPPAQVEYGLAWYIELMFSPETPIVAGGPRQRSDLNHDGGVDSGDLSILLGAFGSTAAPTADINNDGRVDASDLAILIGYLDTSGMY